MNACVTTPGDVRRSIAVPTALQSAIFGVGKGGGPKKEDV